MVSAIDNFSCSYVIREKNIVTGIKIKNQMKIKKNNRLLKT